MVEATITAPDELVEPVGANPFHNADYKRWWFGTLAAGLGVGVQLVTVPLFVRDRVDSDDRAIALAAALICQTLPAAFLVLIGGVVADRVERRRILVRTYLLAAAVSVAYVFLAAGDVGAIWPVFPLAAIIGAANAFTQPARQSMVPQMLAQPQLQNGVILGTVGFMAAFQFGGPALAGGLVDGIGLEVAFAFEVLFLAAAALLYSRIATDVPQSTGRSVRGDMGDGLAYVRSNPAIVGLLAIATLPGLFFIAPFTVTIVLMVNDVLEEGDVFVGVLTACFGFGVVAGSLLMTLRRLPRRGLVLLASSVTGGLILVVFGLSETTVISMVVLLVWGLGAAVFINLSVALIQEYTEKAMMGRVMSMYNLAFLSSLPIGYAQAGIIASIWGPQTALVSSGAAVALIGASALLFMRRVRSLA